MSRSQYTEQDDQWQLIRWRGAVAAAIRGKRGQAFLREMLVSLDALPEPRLIKNALVEDEECCGIGAVALSRLLDVSELDPEDYEAVAKAFGLAVALVRELAFENDEACMQPETPEARFLRVRAWVQLQIRPPGLR